VHEGREEELGTLKEHRNKKWSRENVEAQSIFYSICL